MTKNHTWTAIGATAVFAALNSISPMITDPKIMSIIALAIGAIHAYMPSVKSE